MAGERVGNGDQQAKPATARSCGTCTMCCKLIKVTEINKPNNVWCTQCTPGNGCRIYASRPDDCRTFQCYWLTDRVLGEEWRPDRAKFVMTKQPGTGRIFIVCDANSPSAWRREPYYSKFKAFLMRPGNERKQVVILTGQKLTLLVRQGEFDLGELKRDEEVQVVINYDREDRVVRATLVPAQPGEKNAVGT
jgi:hypothetical protein